MKDNVKLEGDKREKMRIFFCFKKNILSLGVSVYISEFRHIFIPKHLLEDCYLMVCFIPWWLRGQNVHLQCGRPRFSP